MIEKTDKYYRVQFYDSKKEIMTFFAKRVNPSSFLGLIEVSEILFMDSEIIINPDDEKVRKEFSGVSKTFLPLNTIVRIDEIDQNRGKVLKLLTNKPS